MLTESAVTTILQCSASILVNSFRLHSGCPFLSGNLTEIIQFVTLSLTDSGDASSHTLHHKSSDPIQHDGPADDEHGTRNLR